MRFLLVPLMAACLFAGGCSDPPHARHGGSEREEGGGPPTPPLPPPSEWFQKCVGDERSMAVAAGQPGACAEMILQNQMSDAFVLRSIALDIDGVAMFRQAAPERGPALEAQDNRPLFIGKIAPGEHEIHLELLYAGHGEGVFAYLDGYKFRVRSSHTLSAAPGHPIRLHLAAYEKGGITTPLEERPAVRFVDDPESPPAGP